MNLKPCVRGSPMTLGLLHLPPKAAREIARGQAGVQGLHLGVESTDVGCSQSPPRPEHFYCGGRGSIMPSGACTCSLAPRGGWAGGSGLRSEPLQVGSSQAGSPCVEVGLARKETDRRGGKGHVRILTDITGRETRMCLYTPAHTEAPGEAGERGAGQGAGSGGGRRVQSTAQAKRSGLGRGERWFSFEI